MALKRVKSHLSRQVAGSESSPLHMTMGLVGISTGSESRYATDFLALSESSLVCRPSG